MAVIDSAYQVFRADAGLQLLLALLAVVTVPLVQALHAALLHPLARFPGPKLWAVSRLPYVYYLLTGKLVSKTRELHERYGDIVRLAPDELSFASEQAWTDIYTYRRGHKRAARDKTWYMAPENTADNIVTTADEKFHARARAVLSNCFTEAALREQFKIVEGHADVLCAQLYKHATTTSEPKGALLNMTDWLNFFTMDVIGDLAFGEPFGCLPRGDYHDWVRTLFSYLKGMIIAAACRFNPVTEMLMNRLIPKSVLDGQKRHASYANERINRRLDSGSTRPDFITPFLKGNADYLKMSRDEILSTFNFVIVGGSETTATTLTGIFSHLVKPGNAAIMQRLTAEIRAKFAREADIKLDALVETMPYLEATIQEGLRMCNPIPGGLFRTVPKGGDTYCGEFVPEGTHITIRPFAVLRSSKYFADPDSFVPDRWLTAAGDGNNNAGDPRPARYRADRLSASRPFSVGFHSCLGRPLAMTELRLVLARLLWAFDFAEDPARRVDFDRFKVMVIIQKEPMFLHVKARGISPSSTTATEAAAYKAETLSVGLSVDEVAANLA